MKKEITKETYEANINLNILYDVLSALIANGSKQFYPDDINNEIDKIILKLNRYIYHGHDRYDVIEENGILNLLLKKIKMVL